MEDREYRERVLRERAKRRKKAAEMRRRRRRQGMAVLLIGVLLIVLVAVGISKLFGSDDEAMKGQTQVENSQQETADSSDSREQDVTEEEQNSINENMEAIENAVTEATIAAVGDIMVHDTQLEFAYDWETGEFDFAESFEVISEHLSKPDYTIANLETTFGGIDTWTEDAFQGYTGYPCFNSPPVLANNLKDAGIDFVGTANNHTLDSHADGIQSTIEVLDEVGLAHTGTFTELDAPRYSIQEVNGIRIAIMAYTYGANGFVLPEESKGYFNSFDDYDQAKIDQMYKDVEKAAALEDVDLVAVMLHMGEEYQYTPSAKTQEVVDQLFASGCDIVLGSHPHVLEPFEVRTITNEDGTTRQGFVIYSLANFISSQYYTSETPVHKDVGVMLNMKIQKTGSQKPVITELSFLPTYCQWTTTTIRVIPIEHALNSYESGENLYALSETNYQRMQASRDFFQNTFWPEEYEYELVDGYYVVDLKK